MDFGSGLLVFVGGTLFVALVLGVLFEYKSDNSTSRGWTWRNRSKKASAISLAATVSLGILSLTVLLNRVGTQADVNEFLAVTETVESFRADGQRIENAAIHQNVVEANAWLARARYWESHFGLWYPGSFRELEPIR